MLYRFVFDRDQKTIDKLWPAQRYPVSAGAEKPASKKLSTIAIDVELLEPLGDDADALAFARIQAAFPTDRFIYGPTSSLDEPYPLD